MRPTRSFWRGDDFHGPYWYYNESNLQYGDFMYGAPDGVPDGVTLVLMDKYWNEVNYEWEAG